MYIRKLFFLTILLVSILLIQSIGYSQWVAKARFGLGSQDLYGAQTLNIGNRIYRDQNPVYLAHGVSVAPVKRLPYGDGSTITYHFDAEVTYNNKVWFGFNSVFNSFISVGQIYDYSGGLEASNPEKPIDDMFDFTQTADQIQLKYNASSPLRKYQLNFGYFLFNSSQLKKAIVGHSKGKPIFDFGLMGGFSLVTRRKTEKFYLTDIWGAHEDVLTDGTPIKLSSYYGFIRKYNFGLLGGINIRFNVPGKHELFTFSFWYEEQFLQMMRSVSVAEINGIGYINTFYTKGSHWAFKFSFPVFSYNFTKKKFYRD